MYAQDEVNNSSSLLELIEGSIEGDTIYVSEGTYKFDSPILIKKPITITGKGKVEIISLSKTAKVIWIEVDGNVSKPTKRFGHRPKYSLWRNKPIRK